MKCYVILSYSTLNNGLIYFTETQGHLASNSQNNEAEFFFTLIYFNHATTSILVSINVHNLHNYSFSNVIIIIIIIIIIIMNLQPFYVLAAFSVS
jgi:hypothetical protein